MARSAFVEVNITNPTRLAQDSQDTANNAVKGVTNLNDPNLMSVIEKQNNIGQFAGLTSQYNVLVQNAKDDGIDTTAVTTAYNNLNQFMADILADPDHASDIDRARYKKYQDAYNEELANLQNALQNNANNKFTSAASALSQAASTANVAKSAADSTYAYANSEIAVQSTAAAKAQSAADNAFSQAQVVGSQADSEIAVQSTATAKAQSTADNAFSQAQAVGSQASAEISSNSTATAKAQSAADNAFNQAKTAIDTGNATSQAVTALKDGSTLTIAQLGNGLAEKVANSEYASYKEQTASQIAQMVDNGAFSAYQTQTADLISQKVATKNFSAYQATTADAISSKVESSDFKTYKTQTADLIDDKVSNSAYASDKTQTASQISQMVSNSAFSAYQTQTASQIAERVANSDFTTYKTQTADLISSKVETKDFSSYKDETADAISSKVESSDFKTYKTQTADAITSKVSTTDFNNLKVGSRNLYLKSKAISDGYGRIGNPKVTVEPFDSSTKMWHIVAPQTHGNTGIYLGGYGNGKLPDTSDWSYSADVKGTGKTAWFGIEAGNHKPIVGTVGSEWSRISQTGHFDKADAKTIVMYFDTTDSPLDVYIKLPKLETGNMPTDWSPAPEDLATQSQITQLSGEIGQKVDSDDFSSYKTQTAGLITERVANSDFTTYKTQTADLISSKVETKDFSSYKDETADAISSKVESSDFKTYKTQTADAITSKVSKKDANNVNLIPYSAMPKADNLQWVKAGTGGTLSATTHVFYHNGVDPLYELNTAGSNEVFAISPRFKINANTTYTFQLKGFASYNVSSMDVFVLGRPNGSTSDYTVTKNIIAGAVLSASGVDYRTVTFTTGAIDEAYIRIDNNGSTNGKMSLLGFTELKLEPGDTATPYVYSAEDSMITQMADDINLRVEKKGLISEINLQAGNTLISASKQLTLSSKSVFLDSVDPVIMKSANIDTVLVRKTLTAADISANTFTTNNGTFTVEQDGSVTAKNMTLNGGTLYSPTINASTINGSTINGTTFNGGDRINNANNTAKYYPMTITPGGTYKSTYFNSAVGMQSSVESGGISYKYRSMIADGSGQYLSYDSVVDGQGFQSQSGYTSAKDTTFSNPETITGYVNVTPATGIYLYGPTQRINFAGRSDNIGSNGITMDAYGNVYGQSNSFWWRIGDVNGNQIVNFGIDKAGSNHIEFKRDIDIGNIGINTAHSIIMEDGKGLYINSGSGGRADLNVANLTYTGSVSKSLLSEKRDVKKVDTSYWSQLVNSIDLATYQYKDDDNTSNLRLSGIVDDVNDTKQWQLPDVFVARDEDGKLAGIENVVLQNAMLATIQEQQKEIDKLNGHLLKLEAKLNG